MEDDAQWETVQVRRRRKERELKKEEEVEMRESEDSSKSKGKGKNKGKGSGVEGTKDSVEKKDEPVKSSTPSVSRPSPSNEEDMARLIFSLVENSPFGFLMISGVGDRIQEVTGHVWNKKYKTKFGSIKSFLSKRSDLFRIDSENKVTLQDDVLKPESNGPSPKKAQTSPLKESLKNSSTKLPEDQKLSGKKQTKSPRIVSPKAPRVFEPDDEEDNQESSGNCCSGILKSVLFVSVLSFASMYALLYFEYENKQQVLEQLDDVFSKAKAFIEAKLR